MAYQDQTIKCRDCGKEFVFTARDQEFFAQKGFTNNPTRCKDCRNNRKKKVEEAANRVLYKITCKICGKTGEMATEPRKPDDVLCSECFYEEFKKQMVEKGHSLPTESEESEKQTASA